MIQLFDLPAVFAILKLLYEVLKAIFANIIPCMSNIANHYTEFCIISMRFYYKAGLIAFTAV